MVEIVDDQLLSCAAIVPSCALSHTPQDYRLHYQRPQHNAALPAEASRRSSFTHHAGSKAVYTYILS